MKILTIADTVDYDKKISELILKESPDIILTLGDLKQNYLLDLLKTNIPKIGIYGNHCQENYLDDNDFNIKNIHLKKINFKEYSFYGFEGCVWYKNSLKQYDQNEAYSMFNPPSDIDIVISHCPPEGINDSLSSDAHKGFTAFSDFINSVNKPLVWFHGHTYPPESQKISIQNNTIIVYCNGVEIFDLEYILNNKDRYPAAKSYK